MQLNLVAKAGKAVSDQKQTAACLQTTEWITMKFPDQIPCSGHAVHFQECMDLLS